MTYEQLKSSFGIEIDRGQFDRGFNAPTFLQPYRGDQTDWSLSQKVKPPPLTEDLSHLNGPGKRLTMFRALLAKRGTTIQAIADSIGYHNDSVRAMIYDPKRGSARAREKFYAKITDEERQFIESFRK